MKEGLRVLIADDERPAREKLRRFLVASSSVSVVFEASGGAKALEIVRNEHPDVVFLDIRMPGIDGLAAAESMAVDGGPHIVFVTAYDEHAIRAFELDAADYLLKPFDRVRFDAALARVEAAVATEHMASDVQKLRDAVRTLSTDTAPRERLMVEDGDRTRLVAVADVVRLDSAKNYVRVMTTEGVYRVRSTLTELEGRLAQDRFARINRSQIINLDFVRDLAPAGHGDLDVRMANGATVRLSRRYRDRVSGWTLLG